MKLKKFYIYIAVLLTVLLNPLTISAHPGRTDSDGCHTCRTNCEKWGLEYGEYHCHNGGRSNNSSNSSYSTNNSKSNYRENSINLSYIDLIVKIDGDEYLINGGEQFELNSTEFSFGYRVNSSNASVSIDHPYNIKEGTNVITFTIYSSGKTQQRTIYITVNRKGSWLTQEALLMVGAGAIAIIAFVIGRESKSNSTSKK